MRLGQAFCVSGRLVREKCRVGTEPRIACCSAAATPVLIPSAETSIRGPLVGSVEPTTRSIWSMTTKSDGAIAQLVERLNGIQEVRGSTPLGSTIFPFKNKILSPNEF
jgi:hypothetical protein